MTLSSNITRQLRAKAHALKVVVMIGNNGLTDNVQHEIDQALLAHELIKVRVQTRDRNYLRELAQEISHKQQADVIQIIGHVITFYRPKPEA